MLVGEVVADDDVFVDDVFFEDDDNLVVAVIDVVGADGKDEGGVMSKPSMLML